MNLVVFGVCMIPKAVTFADINTDSFYALGLTSKLGLRFQQWLRRTSGDPNTSGDEYGPRKCPEEQAGHGARVQS